VTRRDDDGPGFGKVRRTLRRIRLQRGGSGTPILIRKSSTAPEVALAMRGLLVLLLIFAVFSVFLLDREGLQDNIDGNVSLIDVIYFTMITVTTVGYGDIVPVSDPARLIDAFFVTPVRIFVWFIFLGTAYQFIIQRLIEEWRMTRLQEQLRDHVILCGFGHSGSMAANELVLRGWKPGQIVVIDQDRDEVARAAERGFICLNGDGSSEELLKMAGIASAHSVIVSVGRDDTTVLAVLTIRELAKGVRVIANVSEPENIKLVKAGGADVVVSPPRFGGVMMADAVESRTTVDFVSELMTYRGSYQLVERDPRAEEIGRAPLEIEGVLIVEVRRGNRRIGLWNEKNLRIEAGDRLLAIDSDAVLKARLA
jgi:voltage-gated potassium channel